ncbi:MAG: hypothetical protein RBS43_10170 [Candidatus Cloacimonas sp.]|nr:hypothetical protein [Candidatus Cloacimonas sp.]
MNSIGDDTDKALQYIHLSSVLTELVNGLDSCLRGNDKTFSHSLLRSNDMIERKQRKNGGMPKIMRML